MHFSQKKFFLIIALTGGALIGIVLVQYLWIDAAVDTQQDQFDKRILSVTNNLEESIRSDSVLHTSILRFVSKASDHKPNNVTVDKEALKNQLQTKIDSLFNRENLDILYEFGLVRHSRKQKVLLSSEKANHSQILASKYKTCACTLGKKAHVNLYFPNKDFLIAKQIGWMLGLSILAILIIGGCFTYMIFTIRRQKKLAEMKNDFINNMTHEFKTPIFSISLASKALSKSKEVQQSQKLNKYLDLIHDESQRLKDQVNKVLQMTLADSDSSTIEKEEVNLHKLIKNVATNSSLLISNKNGTINLKLNAEKHIIYADKMHLSNIIQNLIDNAIKYSKNQPNITITTKDRENGISFSITDKGIGIDAETKKHIFEKFYRAQTGDIHDVKGFGLGLNYVKNIVEAHKGWIKLNSKVNKGSTFTIFLPA